MKSDRMVRIPKRGGILLEEEDLDEFGRCPRCGAPFDGYVGLSTFWWFECPKCGTKYIQPYEEEELIPDDDPRYEELWEKEADDVMVIK